MNALVRGRYLLTAAAPDVVVDGAVHVSDGTIAAVASFADLSAAHPDLPVYGGANDIVTPGFVNTHGHFSEALIIGIAEQYTLWEWIHALIDPVAPHLTEEMAYVGTLLASAQMLRTGITVANDMFVCDPGGDHPVTPGVVRALDDIGLRGVVSYGAGDRRATSPMGAAMEEHAALAEAAATSRLSTFRVGIGGVGGQSAELFARSVDLAVSGGHGVHIHLQEIREEVTATRQALGVTPIEHCAHSGLFSAPTLAAHCCWVDANDRQLLAEHHVGVAHNPVSNMILASGVCPVPELRRLGVDVGLGVDGPASNDRQDMTEVIKSSVLLARVDALQATVMSARDAFEMATIGGARALRLEGRLGSLQVGKDADLVVFDGDSPALANIHDPFQALVYCAGPREVRDVWVAGERSLAAGEVVHVDLADVVERSRPLARELVQAAGLSSLSLLASDG